MLVISTPLTSLSHCFPKCSSGMRQSIAAVAGHLDVDDIVIAVLLKDLDRQPTVRQRFADGLRIDHARQIIRKPLQADLHAAAHSKAASESVKGRSEVCVVSVS